VRAGIVAALAERSGLAVDDAHVDAMVRSDHLLDAWVCALIAAAVLAGATDRPGASDVGVAAREGWIHVADADWRGPSA